MFISILRPRTKIVVCRLRPQPTTAVAIVAATPPVAICQRLATDGAHKSWPGLHGGGAPANNKHKM